MLLSFELLRWAGVAFIMSGMILAGIEMSQEMDDPAVALISIGSIPALVIILGLLAPDLLLNLSYILGLGGWIFYVLGIVAPVYFASRLLVVR
ncbi:hypothetical protein [Haloarcula litorea]|uniref:hypothetical protein n=1 Tax=Haloarcula litorea TaxID=3032579 RepID=UPI0023E87708|nr:hypothetical protein [Halomicroarcula sp. GDY20]